MMGEREKLVSYYDRDAMMLNKYGRRK